MSTALQWFKSSYSSEQGGQCLEVSTSPAAIHIRDSKNIPTDDEGTVTVTPAAWSAFLLLARR